MTENNHSPVRHSPPNTVDQTSPSTRKLPPDVGVTYSTNRCDTSSENTATMGATTLSAARGSVYPETKRMTSHRLTNALTSNSVSVATIPSTLAINSTAVQSRKTLSNALQKCMTRDGLTSAVSRAPAEDTGYCRKPIIATPTSYQAYLNNNPYSCETQL